MELSKQADINSNLQKLDSFKNLLPGWDGHDAPAIPLEIITKTRELIDVLPIQPEIFTTALKTIQLEFENSQKDHMEIEVNESDTTEIFIVTHKGNETIETIPADISSIKMRVLLFFEL